jgi:predicted Zn-dependent protease
MLLVLVSEACFAQTAYPDSEAAAAWRGLAAGYVRKALRDGTLNRDPALNARLDAVMAAVGTAVAAVDRRFADAPWTALLIEGFGRGAAAFPGGIILVDAKFVRQLKLNDDELALILCHEAAHVVAGHASAKLSFMAGILGKDRIPTARTALLEFLAKDSYAGEFQSLARLQEREADAIGAAIFAATAFDPQRALGVFDKLAATENAEEGRGLDTHDSAITRKRAIAAMIANRPRSGAARTAATAAAAGP